MPANTKEDVEKAIEYVDLLMIQFQVTDGPRNSKERVENQEKFEATRKLTHIRRTLHRALEDFEPMSTRDYMRRHGLAPCEDGTKG